MASRLCSFILLLALTAIMPFAQYIPAGNAGTSPSSGTGLQKGNGSGGFTGATADTDYQSSVVHNVITIGAKCDGTTDDTTALNSANATGIWYFPPNSTCIVDNEFLSANGLQWVGNNTTLKHKATSTTQMLNFQGSDDRISGFKFDMNGVNSQSSAFGGCNANAFICFGNGLNMLLENSHFLNSGTIGGLWDIEANAETGIIRNVTFEATTAANQILVFATPANGVLEIGPSNSFSGPSGHDDNGITTEFNASGSMVNIHDNNFQNQYSITGQGPNGNGIVVFQNPDGAHTVVHHNFFYNMAYTAVRVNQSFNVIIDANRIDNPVGVGEGAIYCSELGGDGCIATNNQISHYQAGITDTNIPAAGSRVHPEQFVGNHIYNMLGYCIHLENAAAISNICDNSPIGIQIGAGSTGYGNIAALNQFNNVPVHIEVEAALATTPNNQVGGNIVNNGTVTPAARVVPMQLSGGCGVTGITKANPAVVSWNTCTLPVVNQVYLIQAIYGMTEINGKLCQVSAVTGTTSGTLTCGGGTFPINSSAFSTYANPPAGQGGPQADLVYSTGTTLNYSIPSTVVALQ